MKNHYLTLELEITATLEQIKKAYRLKAVKYHPDKHFGDEYFTQKFIEVKEAYDVLTDSEKRRIYDLEYKAYFVKEEPQREQKFREEKRKQTEKEEEFFYDPYKPFYSRQDRKNNETPQFPPKTHHSGKRLDDDIVFFAFPKNIGKIISGYSNLKKKIKPISGKEKKLRLIKYVAIAILVSLAIIFLFKLESIVWIIIWSVAPLGIGVGLANLFNKIGGECDFVGINGFAEFWCNEKLANIQSLEINFRNVTDLLSVSIVNKVNFHYKGTDYGFVWFNEDKLLRVVNNSHDSKEDKPHISNSDFWLNNTAEKYWTIYLLDNMEKELEIKGYLNFNLIEFVNDKYIRTPFIHLGIGFIKFISKSEEFTYKFNDIKRVYKKGTSLFIEHKNFEKKLLFFKSGNKNEIPLLHLSNRQFFFKAMELLIGFTF